MGTTYIPTIWRLATLLIMPDFVEVILIQLPNKAGKVAVLKVFWKNGFRELFVL